MHDGLPRVTDSLLSSARLIGTALRKTPRNRRTHRSCNAPPRRCGHLHRVCKIPQSASKQTRLTGSKTPMRWQVFGLADVDLAIHLVPVASRNIGSSAWYGFRFHSLLRGSSGLAPDSLSIRPRPTLVIDEAGTN